LTAPGKRKITEAGKQFKHRREDPADEGCQGHRKSGKVDKRPSTDGRKKNSNRDNEKVKGRREKTAAKTQISTATGDPKGREYKGEKESFSPGGPLTQ